MSPMPAAIFQKIAPRYSRNIFVVRKTATPALTPRRLRAAPPSAKPRSYRPRMKAKSAISGGSAMTGDPIEEVLLVECPQSPPVGDDAVGQNPPDGRRDDRDEMPCPPQVGVFVCEPVDRLVQCRQRVIQCRDRRRDVPCSPALLATAPRPRASRPACSPAGRRRRPPGVTPGGGALDRGPRSRGARPGSLRSAAAPGGRPPPH